MYFILFNMTSWHFWVYFDINSKLLSGKNTQQVKKQNIRDSLNWVFDELNEIHNLKIKDQNHINNCHIDNKIPNVHKMNDVLNE